MIKQHCSGSGRDCDMSVNGCFTCCTSCLSCMDKYLAIDSGGYLGLNIFCNNYSVAECVQNQVGVHRSISR